MTIVVLLVIVAVVGAIAIVLAGRSGQQAEFEPDRPNFLLPVEPLASADIDAVRFSVGVRGYRMDQVDEVMDRLAAELADRDRQLAELRGEDLTALEASDVPAGEAAVVQAELADNAADAALVEAELADNADEGADRA